MTDDAPVQTTEDRLAEFEKRFEAQAKELETLRRDNMMMASARPQAAAPAAVPTKAPTLDLKGLPDPVVDAEAYNQALQQRYNTFHEARSAYEKDQAAAQAGEAKRANDLQAQFQAKYPHLDLDLAKVASNIVWEQAAAKGIDLATYAFKHTDEFFKDIEAKYTEKFGKVEPKASTTPSDPTDPDAALRTMGVFGGQGSTVAPSARKEAPATTLHDEVTNWQRTVGLL